MQHDSKSSPSTTRSSAGASAPAKLKIDSCSHGCGCESSGGAKASAKPAAKPVAAPALALTPVTPASSKSGAVAADEGERRFVQGPDRRQSRIDRRTGLERRQTSAEDANYTGGERRSGVERRVDTGLERRRGPGRRRADDRREAEEGEMNVEQFEFIKAIETYKKVNKRLYPTWTEILEIVRQLGYRKVLPREVQLENVPEPALSKVA